DVQSPPLQLTCNGKETGLASLVATAGAVTLKLVGGEIYWISVYGRINTSELPRFADVVKRDFSVLGGASLSQPFSLLVEVATNQLPAPADVWRALTPQLMRDDGQSGDYVKVSIRSNQDAFRNLYRAELQRQTWYWRGRETRQFPS